MEEQILNILKEFRPDVDPRGREDLIDGGLLDSLDIVNIVAEFESVFDVSIPVEEIVPENFNSAGAMVKMIDRLKEEE
jgi:D-alanine--poly(phosphoribitol) ligase subunit 2